MSKESREAKAKAQSEQARKNLAIAAKKWNKMTEAQKKAARNWGTGTPPPKKDPWWKKIL